MRAILCALTALFALSLANEARAEWIRAESAHFIVYSNRDEASLRESIATLEQFDALLRNVLQPAAPAVEPNKLEVYLLRSSGDLRTVAPNVPANAGGIYSATKGQVAAFVVNSSRLRNLQQNILFHEYAHHFMAQYFPEAYPTWFSEGFAEYVGSARFTDDTIIVGDGLDGRVEQLRRTEWISLDGMLKPSPAVRVSGQFYALSWLATHYLMNNPERMQGFARYMRAFQAGEDPVEAFEPAFGVTRSAFVRELSDYFNGGMQAYGFAPPQAGVGEIAVTRLPASADDVLLLQVRMYRWAGNDTNGLANDLRRIAERHPGDLMAQRAWANAELWAGRPLEARAVLEPLLQAHPDDVHTLHLMGYTYISEAERGPPENFTETAAQGRRYFARAARLAPNYVPALSAYADTYMRGGGPMPDGPLDVLLQAHLLAPQVQDLRLQAGLALMGAGGFDEAVPILRPLAAAPHGGQIVEVAQRALEHAERGEPMPPPEQN